jgi:2-keto-3-deoxy-L-arabinonate dehydratase
MTSSAQRPYRGVFPVAPTIFDANGGSTSTARSAAVDFMIDAGSHGMCILANFSEQFVLTDAERETVMHAVLEHVAGRVPVIVTTTHFSHRRVRRTLAAAHRPPVRRWSWSCRPITAPPSASASRRSTSSIAAVSDAISIPIMVQDAPVAGTPLSVAVPGPDGEARSRTSAYFKIEVPQAAAKLRG